MATKTETRIVLVRKHITELIDDYEEVSTNDISRWCKMQRQVAWRHLNALSREGVINKIMLPKGIAWTRK